MKTFNLALNQKCFEGEKVENVIAKLTFRSTSSRFTKHYLKYVLWLHKLKEALRVNMLSI